MQIELELLAPAKNKDIGIAAIDCGADAVYIAGPKFGARESAGNSISEIAELVGYAHKFGAKVYMVVNTILYDNELEEAAQTIRDAHKIGCDAIIVQDLSVLDMDLPPIPLFASTQTNIRTPEQAVFLESLGFRRLILARELSLEQIAQIKGSVNTDIETFVHGALCVSYSGQCYLSQCLTGRSANRGSCAQACRSLYTLTDSAGKVLLKDYPILSLKDFNLSNRIPDLVKAGVTSFKIEGRLKNISYIKNVVKLYREKLDEFLADNPGYIRASAGENSGGFTPNAYLTFNRGYTEFFIDSNRGKWQSGEGAKYIGEPVGKITRSWRDRQGFFQFTYTPLSRQSANNNTPSPTPIVNGDGLCFVSRSGQITGIRANSCNSNTVTTTEKTTIPEGSVIYRNLNIAFERELEKNMPQRVIPVDLFMRKGPAGNLELVAEWGRKNEIKRYNCTIAVEGEFESASNAELAKANLFRQLGKNAGIFKFNLCAIDEDVEIPFIPIGQINGLRRALAEKIEAIIPTLWNGIEDNGRKPATAAADGKDGAVKLSGQKLNYLANCSNKISYNLYKRVGAAEVAPAYELEPVAQAELMRTKYCIKYELGLCPNWKVRAKSDPQYKNRIPQYQITEPLFLLNGRSRLELKFDCSNCQMLIIG